jgi:hypothetical protein
MDLKLKVRAHHLNYESAIVFIDGSRSEACSCTFSNIPSDSGNSGPWVLDDMDLSHGGGCTPGPQQVLYFSLPNSTDIQSSCMIEQVRIGKRKRGEPMSFMIMSALVHLVKIGASSKQLRLFLHQNHLTHLRMDAQSLMNLKMRVLRSARLGKLNCTLADDLQGESHVDDVGHLFSTVFALANSSTNPDSYNTFVASVSYISLDHSNILNLVTCSWLS